MPRGSDDAITKDVLIGIIDWLTEHAEFNEDIDPLVRLKAKAERIDAPRGRKAKEASE